MKKEPISIKKFVNDWKNLTFQKRESYIRDNLAITTYLPFINKVTLVEKLVDVTTYKYEDYIKNDGTPGRRKTDTIDVNSITQYLLFCRMVIENYTNLIIETEGFYEEYDLLKSSGLLDELMVTTETRNSLIPQSEIAELRSMIQMRQGDIMTNYCEIHNFVNSQLDRFGYLLNVIGKPVMEKVVERIDENVVPEDFAEVK